VIRIAKFPIEQIEFVSLEVVGFWQIYFTPHKRVLRIIELTIKP